MKRPLAVMIPVIVSAISGISSLVSGLTIIVLGGFFSFSLTGTAEVGILVMIIGFVMLLFAVLYLITSWGLYQMNSEYKWAWWVAFIVSFFNLFSLPAGTILSIILLISLWTVRDRYGVKISFS